MYARAHALVHECLSLLSLPDMVFPQGGSMGDMFGGISKRFTQAVEGAKEGVRGAADSLSQSASNAASG